MHTHGSGQQKTINERKILGATLIHEAISKKKSVCTNSSNKCDHAYWGGGNQLCCKWEENLLKLTLK